jgi:hypothetical protein
VALFWDKVKRIFGEIPPLIRLILEFNGFDTLLALKGIRWDDKKYFFDALDESVQSIAELDDSDELKQNFMQEVEANHQRIDKFKLKLGHKNLIINLCHELQKVNIEEFNGIPIEFVNLPEPKRLKSDFVVRKQQEEHGYSIDNDKTKKDSAVVRQSQKFEEITKPEQEEEEVLQFVMEDEEEEEEENTNFMELEYLEELEHYEEEGEVIEYQEIHHEDGNDENDLYTTEQIIKNEADSFENSQNCYDIKSDYGMSPSNNHSGPKNKKPKHMYTEEFLQTQMTHGRIGTPGRRRPKIQKHYPETEQGLMDRWADLVRQSCEVIVPTDLLSQHDLSHIELIKIHENIWEVKCPLCTKKLRLQLTHEGKYTNYKRSNFERHLRIVHYKQILQFKADDEEHMFEEAAI